MSYKSYTPSNDFANSPKTCSTYQFRLLPWLVNPLRPVARSPDQPSGDSNVSSRLMSEYQIVMINSGAKICSSDGCRTMVRTGRSRGTLTKEIKNQTN
jgi:hypothetical protein